jgi:Undecaprenyl-phosphate glucose phosphotransferase
MLKRYSRVFVACMIVADGALIWLSWIAAYAVRFYILPGQLVKGLPPYSVYLEFSALVVSASLVSLYVRDIYHSARMRKLSWEFTRIAQAMALAVLLIGAITFFYRPYSLSRGVMAYFFILSLLGISSFRICMRLVMRYLRAKGFNLRFILIVGASPSGKVLARNIERHAHLGLVVEGFLDDECAESEVLPGIPLLGKNDDLPRVLAERVIDQVFIALPRHADHALERILESLSDQVVDIRIVPDFSQFVALNASAEEFEGMPIISLTERPLQGWKRISKRGFDIVFSAAAFILLLPIMALVALAVKATSPGCILYVQERIGYDGRKFRMYKFRSMREDAERETGAVWATRDDPRCTPVGRIIRKFSLDELPQLWNVLRGDMSFVGPRPEREIFVDAFRKKIPLYMMRHKIKSGITGWAQVNGLRGESPIEKRTQLDLFYIRNWSFWFDMKIILLTFVKFIYDDHAY